MKRILFVDSDHEHRRAVELGLGASCPNWELEFADDGVTALEMMLDRAFDVIISDLELPGMDGVHLLDEVKLRYNEAVRFAMSAGADPQTIVRSSGSSHQFFSKPCDPQRLAAAIMRADKLTEILRSDSLKRMVSSIGSLPTVPEMYEEIREEWRKPKASLERIGSIIARDIGLSARILQVVNSAWFALTSPITNVERAVAYLGMETVSAIVLGAGTFNKLGHVTFPGFSVEQLWRHSVQTAGYTRRIAAMERLDSLTRDEAFTASVLHDAGKLVLASHGSGRYGRVLSESGVYGSSAAERLQFGATHGEVGAYLVGLWGLPDSIVSAIAFHSQPAAIATREVDALTLVHVASALAAFPAALSPADCPCLDVNYLSRVGVLDRWGAWREGCLGPPGEGLEG